MLHQTNCTRTKETHQDRFNLKKTGFGVLTDITRLHKSESPTLMV